VYFNVNFNMFFKLIKVHLLVSELYMYQNARWNDIKKNNIHCLVLMWTHTVVFTVKAKIMHVVRRLLDITPFKLENT